VTASPVAIYLNDHLAGAMVGREIARRTAASNRSSTYGPFLAGLAAEIEQDRRSLLEIMSALEVGVDRVKLAAGWSAEKLGRLKLNGRLLGYSPLSRVVELEALALGVQGKLRLWRSLELLAAGEPRLVGTDLAELVERALRQTEQLEEQRLRAVADAFP
jgi:hypothetical protein